MRNRARVIYRALKLLTLFAVLIALVWSISIVILGQQAGAEPKPRACRPRKRPETIFLGVRNRRETCRIQPSLVVRGALKMITLRRRCFGRRVVPRFPAKQPANSKQGE